MLESFGIAAARPSERRGIIATTGGLMHRSAFD